MESGDTEQDDKGPPLVGNSNLRITIMKMKPLAPQTIHKPSTKPVEHIIKSTEAKIHVFLTEISLGVTNYRSLHSFTEQVEHQYLGRFLLELIQNAHDALKENLLDGEDSRISLSLIEDDSEFGTLYVANDGRPFTASNFKSLSELGQSDKDPQKSIGNKGIGFRSVLEICTKPEIYSRLDAFSQKFDGYCFGFDPNIILSLADPILELKDGAIPILPFTQTPLVGFSEKEVERFKSQVNDKGLDWLHGELKYLSPYLLPIPINNKTNRNLAAFEDQGYSTVVRLVLKSEETKKYVQEKISELSSSTVLFLDKLTSLSINNLGNISHIYNRTSNPYPGLDRGSLISIGDSDITYQYASWTKTFLVKDTSQEFQSAVKALPGKWPDISEISLSLAVKMGDSPEEGKYSIYLPTLLPSGSATHINAPFFADMSRTSINFDDAFNAHLLEAAAKLALDIVRNTLAGKGSNEARLIVDLLCPLGSNGTSIRRWKEAVSKAEGAVNVSIDNEELFLTQNGWRPLNTSSVLPPFSSLVAPSVITPERLRKHATFNIFHSELESREEQIKALTEDRYETGIFPTSKQIAETLEKVAEEILSFDGDWNGFWEDVIYLFRQNNLSPQALNGYNLIIGNDGQLHAASDTSTVFFYPKQGTADVGEITEGQSLEVPQRLQTHVAFLSDKIRVYEETNPAKSTAIRGFLANGLVTQFRNEDIFTTVLQKHLPQLPIGLQSKSSNLCCDILLWGLRLIDSTVARGRASEAVYKLARILPVPCNGGWYPLSESSFGPEWPDTTGNRLNDYLSELDTPSSKEALQKVLLPPSHKLWRSQGLIFKDILVSAGVFDGLRLEPILSNSWQSVINSTPNSFRLPQDPPSRITKSLWQRYRENVFGRSQYLTAQQYVVGEMKIFPGFENFDDLSISVKKNLSELILHSLSKWTGYEQISTSKRYGELHRVPLKSPLKFFLETARWLAIDDSSGTTLAVPNERWYVHEKTLVSRVRNFAHLSPLPLDLAKRLAKNNELANALISLGMPYFDLETITQDSKLVEALAKSVGNEIVSESNILLGQIRDAWRVFRPATNREPLEVLVVRRSSRQLERFSPSEDTPAYLPDLATYVSELEQFDLPVITIDPSDARNLRDWFIQAYGSRIQLTSELSLKPFVNEMPWIESDAVPFLDSDLSWFFVPLLSIVAFWGQQPRGINSVAFRDRLDVLKVAKVDWVTNLTVGLMKDDQKIVETSVPALWHKETRTIIASEVCRDKLYEISAALSEALNRDDLEFPLKLALTKLAPENVSDLEIREALSSLKISEEHLQQIEIYLRGDIGNIIRWLDILYKVICPAIDTSELQNATSEEEIIAISHSYLIDGATINTAVKAAKNASDMFEFGCKMHEILGETIALPAWNKVLVALHLAPLKNRSCSSQIQVQLEEVSATAKKIFAHLIKSGVGQSSFMEMFTQFRNITETSNLDSLYWEIKFQTTMELFANLLTAWNAPENLIKAVQTSHVLEELKIRLRDLEIDIDSDPDGIYRTNNHLIETLANELEKIRLAWGLRNYPPDQRGDWKNETEKYKELTNPHLKREGFVRLLDPNNAYSLLKETELFKEIPEFWKNVSNSESIEELRTSLGLTEDDIKLAEDQLAIIRNEINRKKNVVKVCGREFDNSEENLSSLWTHIEESISDEDIATFEPLDLGKHVTLERLQKSKRIRTSKSTRSTPKKTTRSTKAMNDLVGLAGEILAFRMLQSVYGTDVVSPSAWVSENSLMRFPQNLVDDTKGFDITFTHGKTLYRVEVKSTSGEDESFSLGSSEIKLAMDLARPRRGQKEVYILVHVKNALSDKPEFNVLPNPYHPKHLDRFVIEEAEARVRYRTS